MDKILANYIKKNGTPPAFLPDGFELIDVSTFFTSFQSKDDTLTERLVAKRCNDVVQIIRYDEDDSSILVFVNTNVEIMSIDGVEEYIKKCLKEGSES